jgi:hypothetical protein
LYIPTLPALAFCHAINPTLREVFLIATLISFTEEIAMPNSDLLPSRLFKINENQLALEAAIMELTL